MRIDKNLVGVKLNNMPSHKEKAFDVKKSLNDAVKAPKNDKLTISNELRQKLQLDEETAKRQKELKDRQENMLNEIQNMKEMLAQEKERSEQMQKQMENYNKCMQIASRIMMGDDVPTKDHNFLMENNREIYAKALTIGSSMRMIKSDIKKHKSVLNDDENSDFDRIIKELEGMLEVGENALIKHLEAEEESL